MVNTYTKTNEEEWGSDIPLMHLRKVARDIFRSESRNQFKAIPYEEKKKMRTAVVRTAKTAPSFFGELFIRAKDGESGTLEDTHLTRFWTSINYSMGCIFFQISKWDPPQETCYTIQELAERAAFRR